MQTLFDKQIEEDERIDRVNYEHWVETHTRPSHPSTSVEGAEHMAPKVGEAMAHALGVLWECPKCTAAELDSISHGRDGTIRKRLSDLRAKGLARTTGKRKCRITGRNAQTWEAVDPAERRG